MGIVNVTPDSFSDGGMLPDTDAAIAYGAASPPMAPTSSTSAVSRPARAPTPCRSMRSLRAWCPWSRACARRRPATSRSASTRAAPTCTRRDRGRRLDRERVTAAAHPGMFPLVRDTGVGLVLMHMLGEPKTMQVDPRYDNVVTEVRDFLADRIGAAVAAGRAARSPLRRPRHRLREEPPAQPRAAPRHRDLRAAPCPRARGSLSEAVHRAAHGGRRSRRAGGGLGGRGRGAPRTASTWFACTTCSRWPGWWGDRRDRPGHAVTIPPAHRLETSVGVVASTTRAPARRRCCCTGSRRRRGSGGSTRRCSRLGSA